MEPEVAAVPAPDSRAWLRTASAVCFGVLLAALLCLVLYKIRLVFVPFAAGFVVAYIFDPWLDKLEARGWSRSRSVWTVMGSLVTVLVVLAVLLVPRVVTEVSDVWENQGLYAERAQRFYDRARASAEARLGQYLGQSAAADYLDQQVAAVEKWARANEGAALAWLGARVAEAGSLVILALLGTLAAFHFMLVIDPLRETTQRLFLSPRQSEEMDETVARVNRMLGAYVRGLAAVSAIVALASALSLSALGFYFGTRYALVIGLLAGVTYAVPWVGQASSAGAAFFFGLVTAEHNPVMAAVVCALAVIAVNQFADNVLVPRIVGGQVGLHPLLVLFSILAGFQLFGLVGMIIAVPLAASIRIGVRRWIPLLPDDEAKPGGLPRIDVARLVDSVNAAVRRFTAPIVQIGHKEPPAPPPPADRP